MIWSEVNLLNGFDCESLNMAIASVRILCNVCTWNELIILSLSINFTRSSLGEFLFTLCGDCKCENSLAEKNPIQNLIFGINQCL